MECVGVEFDRIVEVSSVDGDELELLFSGEFRVFLKGRDVTHPLKVHGNEYGGCREVEGRLAVVFEYLASEVLVVFGRFSRNNDEKRAAFFNEVGFVLEALAGFIFIQCFRS